MTNDRKYLKLKGIAQPVAISVDDRFIEALDFVFPKWPYKISDTTETSPFLSISYDDERYQLSSEHMDKPVFWNDPLNTICEMVVEVAWAQLRQDPSLLCLHGAAIEFAGRLVVFPATKRAGKSTLSVALAAAGHKIYTDDFLPVMLSEDQELLGISNGISPRLRLPVPTTFGDRANSYIANRSHIRNRQYQYVTPRDTELAVNGQTAPLGALVYLQREDLADASIQPIQKAEALRDLIVQNFSRAINAHGILLLLDFAVTNLPIYRLKYHDVDQAIDILQAKFSDWEAPTPRVSEAMSKDMFGVVLDQPDPAVAINVLDGQFKQKPDIFVVEADGKKFLTGRNGKSIHLLNDLAAAIWNLLAEPVSLDEAIEIVTAAFPDQTVEQVTKDVTQVFKSFAACNILEIVHHTDIQTQHPAIEGASAQ